MRSVANQHPDPEELAAFSLGRVNEGRAVEIADHLNQCETCCRIVLIAPADSFVGLVRESSSAATHLAQSGRPTAPAMSDTASSAVPRAAPEVPPELGSHPRYEVLGVLGHGGMGSVYLAEHRLMRRRVAIKVVNRELLSNAEAVQRFQDEIRALSQLDHPHIVRAYDAEQAGELQLFVMEFVEGSEPNRGTTLEDVLRERGPLPVETACRCISQAALGLQHAFEKGILHRDVKPSNLMLTRTGDVKVTDFGLTRLTARETEVVERTPSGRFLGTPPYVAPEQARDARQADVRSDIYSLGCTLYCLLAGHPPFQKDTPMNFILAHISEAPPSLAAARPDLPPELGEVIARMLAKDPAHRYGEPAEVVRALARFCGVSVPVASAAPKPAESSLGLQQPTHRRRVVLIGAVLSAALLAGLIGGWAGGIFRVKTLEGVLVVEVDTPNPDVYVDGTRMTVTWREGRRAEIRVEPGTHRVEVKKEGFTSHGEVVDVYEGKQKVMTARLVRDPGGERDFRSLFNGKNLDGWTTHPKEPSGWTVEKGELVGRGPNTTTLFSRRDDYRDFHVRLEVRSLGPGTAGLGFRYAYTPFLKLKPERVGYVSQLHTEPDRTMRAALGFHCALAGEIGCRIETRTGEWARMEVIAKGYHLRVLLDGKECAAHEDARRFFTHGHLALFVHNGWGLAVRKVEIKELPTP